jgi:two-component system, NtrC family, nitrogen regulation sensor histidine kinase NtrY
MLKNQRQIVYLSALFFFFVLLGLVLRHFADKRPQRIFSVEQVEKTVQGTLANLSETLEKLPLESFTSHEELWNELNLLQLKDCELLIFQGVDLVAWTNQLLPVDGINPNYLRQPLVRLDNGWYLTAFRQEGPVLIVAFSLLKNEYFYQNQFLQDGFSGKYKLDASVLLSREELPEYYSINDRDGAFLFSLITNGLESRHSVLIPYCSIAFVFAIFVLWLLFYNIQKWFQFKAWTNLVWFLSVAVFSLFYYVVIWKNGLPVISSIELFSPLHFAVSSRLPSLGHFLLYAFLLLTVAFWFFKFFKLPAHFSGLHVPRKVVFAALVLLMLVTGLYTVYITRLLYVLAEHSSGPLVLTKVIDIDFVAFSKILIVSFLLLSFLFIFERVVVILLYHYSRVKLLLAILATTLLMIISFGGLGVGNSDWAFLFYLTSGVLLIFTRRGAHMTQTYSTFLWFAGLFAIYAGMVMMDMTIRKEEDNRELLIENLSFQLLRDEDPVAEMYLSEIEKQISNDATLMRLLAQPELDSDAIRNHLVKFYFYGFWGRYDLQIIPCWPQGDLYIEETHEVRNCYSYFFQMLDSYGYSITESNHFHYLDNNNGRVSYFGVFRYFPNDQERETSLFIELNSKAFFEGLGYPELLVSDREQARVDLFNEYSHAKYLYGRLVKRSGDYPYKSDAQHYASVLYDKVFIKEGDYSHLVYQPDPNVKILLSRHDYIISDVFMAFSLYFIFFFLAGAVLILFMQWRISGFTLRVSIQKRIQVSFVVLMLVMLVIVATGTVWYTVQQFKRKHLELLENKIQSVLLELEYKIGFDGPETSSPEEYLNYQLQMISNVFYCDINLYGVDGKLIGTSRPELYRNGLSGVQMNPRAYYSLAYTDAVRHLDEERIGSLDFISFYVPVLSSDNQLAGFVNLPYFVGNNELREEVSSVVVTVINFYLVFSFLVIGLAVFLARQITRPLLMLQDRISRIKLDRFNEKIDYKADDEIGGLVSEYNRMVDELAVSAEMLAKTERELAWREMAKQIAHEIKNPLTPMKLSIQYLQRAWNDKVENFDEYLNRVSATLIEQINTLSSIASEFSKFAQMPSAKAEIVNLTEKIENCRLLFANSTDIPIAFENEMNGDVLVKADGEQLLGVLNNLLKNAIQSIPLDRKGEIKIHLQDSGEMVRIAIRDNGKGIPDDIRKDLFVPSFTTKTGGMGLGLAIARRIVENSGGRIWFESKVDEGSVFYVELPYSSNSLE